MNERGSPWPGWSSPSPPGWRSTNRRTTSISPRALRSRRCSRATPARSCASATTGSSSTTSAIESSSCRRAGYASSAVTTRTTARRWTANARPLKRRSKLARPNSERRRSSAVRRPRSARARELPSRKVVRSRRAARSRTGAKQKQKVRNPYRFEKLEAEIIALEEEKEALAAAMTSEEVYRDADALREHQFRLAEIERDLESKNEEWANWS
ncbi:MAG: hypothetical protein ACYTFV_03825 [Planctomycetota bacterium]